MTPARTGPRVLHIGSFYEGGNSRFAGGKTAAIFDILGWAVGAGHRVTLLTPQPATAEARDKAGFPVISLPVRLPHPRLLDRLEPRIPWAHAWLLRRVLAGALREGDFDLIHNHYGAFPLLPALRDLGWKIPAVSTCYAWHEIEEADKKRGRAGMGNRRREWANRTFLSSQKIVVIADHATEAAKDVGLRLPDHRVIRTPCEDKAYHPIDKSRAKADLGFPSDRRIIQFSGKIDSWRKGFPLLIRALSEDADLRDTSVLVATGGYSDEGLPEKCRSLGIDARFLGRVPAGEDFNRVYNAADVFVMPSISEGWGMVYTEALAAGTPIVGYHRTVSELALLAGADVGRPFDPSRETPADLAAKIRAAAALNLDREAVRARVLPHFTPGAIHEAYSQVYNELLR